MMSRRPLPLLRIGLLGPARVLALLCAVAPAPALAAPENTESAEPRSADPSGGVLPAVARETTPDRTRRESVPDRVREVREQMDEAYQAGLEAYQTGRFDEAKEHFDRAVDIVLSSDIDLNEQPALKKAFDEMVRNIADLDAELYTRESGAEDKENRSPLDEIKDIASYLPADVAAKERQKIQQVAGQISYDIPIDLNAKVLTFVEAFQTRLRGEFEVGLKRSGAYLPIIREIFREEGLPEDLAYMAHQESAFKNNAYSRARAKGMWQFMSFTGRKYGLKIDLWVDERSDFEKSTRAAANYLKDLYARFGDWYLAMAAYNAGEGKIERAIRRARARDYWVLAKTKFIRRETKYYVPAILASILIDKSPEDYGFDVETDPLIKWDTVEVDKPTDLQVIAEGTGASLEEIRALNPELRGLITPPNVGTYTVRVPNGTRDDLLAHLEGLPDEKRVSWTLHEVRPGESFAGIAHKHRVQVRALIDANPRYAGRRLRRGTVLNVPLAGGMPQLALARAIEDRPSYEPGERIVHRVRRGENLQRIAWKYRTTVGNLKRWNGLNGSMIRPGQRLVAYYGEKGDGPRSAWNGAAAVSVARGRIEYRVQPGDTLDSIARKFSAAVDDLCRWNNLGPDTPLQPGDRLLVGEAPGGGPPAGQGAAGDPSSEGAVRHRVRRGDTLFAIAQLYDISVRRLRALNDLEGGSTIYPGQILLIAAE